MLSVVGNRPAIHQVRAGVGGAARGRESRRSSCTRDSTTTTSCRRCSSTSSSCREPRYRLEVGGLERDGDARRATARAARGDRQAERAGLGARLRRHELDPRWRAGRRRGRRRARTRRGRAAQLRPLDAGGAQPDRDRPALAAALRARRAVAGDPRRRGRRRPGRGRRRRDAGRAPAARADRAASARRSSSASGSSRAATWSRRCTGRRTSPSLGSGGFSRGWRGSRSRSSFRRIRARALRSESRDRPEGLSLRSHRAARLPRLRRARLAGARDRHRLGRPAEGGVLVRRPVRDRPAVDGVGRHGRGGRERARRRRPRPARRGGPHRRDAGRRGRALRRRARREADRGRAVPFPAE